MKAAVRQTCVNKRQSETTWEEQTTAMCRRASVIGLGGTGPPGGGGRASEAAKCCLEPSYFSDDEASMPFTLYVRTVIDTYIRDRKCNVILRT